MVEYPGSDLWGHIRGGAVFSAGLLGQVAVKCPGPGRKRRSASRGDGDRDHNSSGKKDGKAEDVCGHMIVACYSGCVAEHWQQSWQCWACEDWQISAKEKLEHCGNCGERRPPGLEMVWRRIC